MLFASAVCCHNVLVLERISPSATEKPAGGSLPSEGEDAKEKRMDEFEQLEFWGSEGEGEGAPH